MHHPAAASATDRPIPSAAHAPGATAVAAVAGSAQPLASRARAGFDLIIAAYFAKWRGAGAAPAPLPPLRQVALASLGAAIALAAVAGLAGAAGLPLILGSFGATCVLVFGYPDAPFSQPRAVIGSHVVSSLIGVAAVQLLGPGWPALAIGVGLAIGAMMALRIVHPPAGSNPIIAVVGHASWPFVLAPTLAGAALIVLWALIYNNAIRTARWPQRW